MSTIEILSSNECGSVEWKTFACYTWYVCALTKLMVIITLFFFFFNISYYCGLLNFFQRFHVCDNSLNPNKINGSKHPIFDRRMFSQLTSDFFFFFNKKIILLQNQALFNFYFLLWLFLNNMRPFFFLNNMRLYCSKVREITSSYRPKSLIEKDCLIGRAQYWN